MSAASRASRASGGSGAPGTPASDVVRVRAADPAAASDVRAVAAVARAAWPATYRDILPAHVVATHLARAYAPDALTERMRRPGGLFLLAEVDGGVGGCVGYCQAGRRLAAPGEADLWAIYVLPAWQRRGVGARMVQAVLAAFADQRLHVALAAANRAAARFYERFGFVPEGSGYVADLVGHPVTMRSMVRAADAPGRAEGNGTPNAGWVRPGRDVSPRPRP
jgi:ribosomal protein S18 acetylase RimI-like enzyme